MSEYLIPISKANMILRNIKWEEYRIHHINDKLSQPNYRIQKQSSKENNHLYSNFLFALYIHTKSTRLANHYMHFSVFSITHGFGTNKAESQAPCPNPTCHLFAGR